MAIKDFNLKWAHGMCRGKPLYISRCKVLIPCDFFIKTCDISGDNLRHHFDPGIKIGCCCSLPELGIVAVSELKTNGAILVLSYPEMLKLSVLDQHNEQYSALQFMGLEFLLSVQIKVSYEIDLWKWSSAEKIHFLSIPISNAEIPSIELLPNPLCWYQVLLQNNMRLIMFQVNYADGKYCLDANSYIILKDQKGNIEMSSKKMKDNRKDFQADIIYPLLKTVTIQCFCWLPENNILISTSSGIIKIEYEELLIHKLVENITGISCMTYSKIGLFVGYKTGFIDIVCISGHRWHVIETINVGQPIKHMLMSPDYNFLTITTLKGSIFLQEIGYGKFNLKALISIRAEFSGEIGVGFIGPLAQFCVAAKKNGILHIFRTFDGSILSTFLLDEEISSMATSPLCCCIVIGSSVGYIYFIDVSNPRKPKIVHCEQPYEIPVEHLKFENFGRFLVASAQNQAVKIWNGLPSYGFMLLGSKEITMHVKDIAVFSRTITDEAILLLLTERGSGSEKESGNLLIRLTLPQDFGSYSKKYHMDVFGALSDEVLSFQSRRLSHLACKMDMHWSLGAVFYSSGVQKVQRYPIWSDFASVKQDDLFSIKNVSCMCIAPNQNWIAVADICGCVCLHSSRDFTLSAASGKHCASQNISKSFIDLPLSSNSLICGRENGITSYYEWVNDLSPETIPEWIMYCYSQFNRENDCLRAMEEEERINLIPQDIEKNFGSSVLNEIYQEVEVWISVLNFKLDQLLSDSSSEDKIIPSNFALNDDSLYDLFVENRKKLSSFTPQKILNEQDVEKTVAINPVKVLSSMSLGLITQNYSNDSITQDASQIENLNSVKVKTNTKNIAHGANRLSFTKSSKFNSKEERLFIVRDLIEQICSLKAAFNKEFNVLFAEKPSVTNNVNEVYSEAKRLTQTLPSKAERDFWNASVEQNYNKISDYIIPDRKDNKTPHKYTSDAIEEAKNSIECCLKSARNIQDRFDSNIEGLLFKKRYYNYNIYRFELNIYIILLLTRVEDEYLNWKETAETEVKILEKIRVDLEGVVKEFSEVERNVKEVYLELQKVERKSSWKVEAKINHINKGKDTTVLLKKQIACKLGDSSQNPFWRSSASINVSDIKAVSAEFNSRNLRPLAVENSEWESMCNKQIRVLKLGIILRNLQTQALLITGTKQTCADASQMLKVSINIIQKSLKTMSSLVSKFSVNFHCITTTVLENSDLKLGRNSIPSEDCQIWKDIELESWKVQEIKQHLDEIESDLIRLNQLKSDVCLKSGDVALEYPDLLKDVKRQLEESKQHFSKTKAVTEEVLDSRRKSVFKILKSHILNESSIQAKIKEFK